MKLSISNIAWAEALDNRIYEMMEKNGYSGLEIAPTRVFTNTPYEKLTEIDAWARDIKKRYGFEIPSMQSIWFGRNEKLFGTEEERNLLLKYTKKAIDFAAVIGCKNLVFGCPRNRKLPENADRDLGVKFFKEVGDYAAEKHTVIGMEANSPLYDTNYINDTLSALELIGLVNSDGFLLNLDVGTMIQNGEDVEELRGKVHLINHVHISEPALKQIKPRRLHIDLKHVLQEENYQGYVSIEMGQTDDAAGIEQVIQYVRTVFYDL